MQLLNADVPILVTPLGITIDTSAEPLNAEFPILKSPEGRVADIRAVQLANELA